MPPPSWVLEWTLLHTRHCKWCPSTCSGEISVWVTGRIYQQTQEERRNISLWLPANWCLGFGPLLSCTLPPPHPQGQLSEGLSPGCCGDGPGSTQRLPRRVGLGPWEWLWVGAGSELGATPQTMTVAIMDSRASLKLSMRWECWVPSAASSSSMPVVESSCTLRAGSGA